MHHAPLRVRRRTRSGRLLRTSLPVLLALVSMPLIDGAALALEGEISLTRRGRPAHESARALVYFEPAEPTSTAPSQTEFEITMVDKQFSPQSLVVPVGSTVRFPNEDTILHNVFSVSGDNRFDLGLYRRGQGKEATFESPGVVRVFCNVHHAMVAYIVVVDTPYYTTANGDGSFVLDAPEVDGTLHVWHPRTEPWSQEISGGADPLEIELTIDKPRVPRHKNKHGRAYSRRGRSDAYE